MTYTPRHHPVLAVTTDLRQIAFDKIARAEQAVDDLCAGRLRWEMRVPAEPDHDPDLIISDALRAAREALASSLPVDLTISSGGSTK